MGTREMEKDIVPPARGGEVVVCWGAVEDWC